MLWQQMPLDSHVVLCQSSVESGGQGSHTGSIPTGSGSASSSSTFEHVDNPSSSDYTNAEEANQQKIHGASPSVSRMTHLRHPKSSR